jgi:ATP-dependent Clp protease, protease subunit
MSDKFKYIIEYNKNIDTLFITGDITEELSTLVIQKLLEINNDKKDLKEYELIIRLNTYGGSASDALSIYDCLKFLEVKTKIIVESYTASAGTLIMLGCDKVCMTKNAIIMIHELSTGYCSRYSEFRNYQILLDMLMNKILIIYNEKLKSPIDKTFLEKDTYFDSGQALEIGLIDEVI